MRQGNIALIHSAPTGESICCRVKPAIPALLPAFQEALFLRHQSSAGGQHSDRHDFLRPIPGETKIAVKAGEQRKL
jgi:hypothetical protein